MMQGKRESGRQAGRHQMQWINVVKALAAWMVVTSHLLRQGEAADFLAAFSVAVFLTLAGFTLHPHKDLRAFILRLVRRIVVPYLAAGLVSIMVYRILGSYAARSLGAAQIHTTLAEDLLHLVYASSVGGRMKWNESLWFLPCYVLMILMAECITRLARLHYLVPLAVYAAGGLVGYHMIAAGIMGLPWHLETALFVLPLCGVGQYMRMGMAGMLARRVSWYAALIGLVLFCNGVQIFPMVEAGAAGGSLSLRAVHLAGAAETYWFLLFVSTGAIYLIWYGVRRCRLTPWLPVAGTRSLDILLWNKFPVLFLQVVVPVVVPGFDTLFIGRTDVAAAAVSMLLAIPCIAACLVWCGGYRKVIRHILPDRTSLF